MPHALFVALLIAAPGCAPAERAEKKVYPHRWVYVSRSLRTDQHVADIERIATIASAHGLNGMVLAAGLDRLDLQPPEYFRRLRRVQAILEQKGLELIPILFSAGYGGSVLAHDRNLAEGLAVREALFVASGGTARHEPDPPPTLVNGGMESYDDHRLSGYALQDGPGRLTFVDPQVYRAGRASLRLENFALAAQGQVRLMQEIQVRPRRQYRISFWVKTENLEPPGAFRVRVLATDGRQLAPWNPRVPASGDWRRLVWGFNSLDRDRVRVYLGVWGARAGRVWLDELRIEEVALVNVLRRPGTPVRVRGEASGTEYEENRDYAPIADPQLDFRFDHDGPAIRLLPGGRIREGERLRVDYYHGMTIHESQTPICMSEPKVYEIWAEQAQRIRQALGPLRHFLLSMDEVRMGGSCEACRRRGLSMAEILGDCISRQFRMLRAANPEAQIWAWSDMLDPNHNARPNYYLVEGDYTGSWAHVPRELGIVTWYYERRRESLAHFSRLGFRTLAGAYYDADDLENPRGWLEALDQTPGASGIMYTTWENKYDLLAAFGDLVSRRR
ncbi:MAG: hypothetical protein RMI94_05755 [Bryobacterales bacterium]|nr:hypothetical protein [Bryobacteraceae bacterium]MDW8130034.1 hypothetical protein [Bryobacterales bacterium]